MAPYRVLLKRKAQKYLDDLSRKKPKDAAAIKEALKEMMENPWSGDVKKMRTVVGYRKRVRSYRIIYRIESTDAVIFVEKIDLHHRAY